MHLCEMARCCAFWCIFGAFLCVSVCFFSYQNRLQKSAHLRRILQKCAKSAFMPCPLSYTPLSQRALRLKKFNPDWSRKVFNPYVWNVQSRLENFNLDWNFQSRLKLSILTLIIPHNKGPCCVARLKFSILIENFNLRLVAWKFQSRSEILNFFNLWALWVCVSLSENKIGFWKIRSDLFKIRSLEPQGKIRVDFPPVKDVSEMSEGFSGRPMLMHALALFRSLCDKDISETSFTGGIFPEAPAILF